MRRNLADLERLRSELHAELAEATHEILPTGERADLMPPAVRRAVADAVAAWPDAGKRVETRRKWRRLVRYSVERFQNPGLVEVPEGGVPALAAELFPEAKRPAAAFSKNLNAWDEQGMIVLFHGEQVKRYPPLLAVQVPVLTECLLWLAHRRAQRINWFDGPSTELAHDMAVLWASAGQTPPPKVLSDAWAVEYLADMRRRIATGAVRRGTPVEQWGIRHPADAHGDA